MSSGGTVAEGLGPLKPGDRVAVLAPAGTSTPHRVAAAQSLLSGWGLQPVTYPSAHARHQRASYLSGSDRRRAQDLTDAWCDETIAGIFCTRGGYGVVRILDLLDRDRMRAATLKPLYGSSDVTALLEWLREQLGAAGWFTPMITTGSLLDDTDATASLRAAVLAGLAGRRWTAAAAEALVPGTAIGTLIGGNVSLLAMTLGARRRPPLDNTDTIALLEDVHEETYKIDGYLHSLLRAGWFEGVRGVALGGWKDCGPLSEIRALCLETLAPLGVPVVWELGFGHGPAAHSLPVGVPATLMAEAGKVPVLYVD